MLEQSELSAVSKAIAGGLAAVVVAELAKYGLNLPIEVFTNFFGVLVTAVLGYLVGHIFVYAAPKNK